MKKNNVDAAIEAITAQRRELFPGRFNMTLRTEQMALIRDYGTLEADSLHELRHEAAEVSDEILDGPFVTKKLLGGQVQTIAFAIRKGRMANVVFKKVAA